MGIAASPGPFWAYSSGPQTKENRWICEAPMQDRQGSGVAVSHQKYDIFNSDRFPHAFCGTLLLPRRRRSDSLNLGAQLKGAASTGSGSHREHKSVLLALFLVGGSGD